MGRWRPMNFDLSVNGIAELSGFMNEFDKRNLREHTCKLILNFPYFRIRQVRRKKLTSGLFNKPQQTQIQWGL